MITYKVKFEDAKRHTNLDKFPGVKWELADLDSLGIKTLPWGPNLEGAMGTKPIMWYSDLYR